MATILDDESIPILTISGGPKIIESDEVGSPAVAKFTVHSQVMPEGNSLNVEYTIDGGSFIRNSGSEMMSPLMFEENITAGNFQASLPITIVSDKMAEPHGRVTITLNNESTITNYIVSNPKSASVLVFDDETLIPLLSVTGPSDPVLESEVATFTISAIEDPIRNLAINYLLEETNSDFIQASGEGRNTTPALKFTPDSSGKYTATFDISLHDDSDTEVRSEIYLTLLEDSGLELSRTYTINFGAAGNGAIATILDNDAPELSIATGPDIVETDEVDAEFKVIANIMPRSGLFVKYTPSSENFLAIGESGVEKTVPNALNFKNVEGQYIAILPVRIHNDNIVESDGTIEVELVDDDSTNRTYP